MDPSRSERARVRSTDPPRKLLSNQLEVMIAATGIPDGSMAVFGVAGLRAELGGGRADGLTPWSVAIGSSNKEPANVSMGPPGESGS